MLLYKELRVARQGANWLRYRVLQAVDRWFKTSEPFGFKCPRGGVGCEQTPDAKTANTQ